MMTTLIWILLCGVLIGTIPILVLILQSFIAGLHGVFNHYRHCKSYIPRIAILLPAWNEADVLKNTIDRLVHLNYPEDRLRVYVIDDASTDATPEVIASQIALYPEQVFCIRREIGGEGKCHTLNAGLKVVLAEPWAEAIMIADADIEFVDDTLQKMAWHLADPKVGAVTCYIKVEKKSPGSFLNKSVCSEYILSQAIARRAQNVTKALACLAGGAQLHSRKNIELIGGAINTTTLAEDTYTTFLTQINHHRAIFEGNAYVKADEPDDLLSFWKQRFRWSRGNIQISSHFRHLWFRRNHSSHLGGIYFGLVWFSTLLMPLTMILTSLCLITLLFIDPERSWNIFRVFYFVSSVSYLFSFFLSLAIDFDTMKRCWFSTLLFPGIISILLMFISILSMFHVDNLEYESLLKYSHCDMMLLLMDIWIAGCMFFSWLTYRLAILGAPIFIIDALIAIVGYGPLLCTITLLAFIAEMRKSSLVWVKTEKKMKSRHETHKSTKVFDFEKSLALAKRIELKFMFNEFLIVVGMIILFSII